MKVDTKKIILIAFMLSGMAALIYEVVWTRPLQLIFGSTIYVSSIILASFMLGIGWGSLLMSKFIEKIKNPLYFYALFELFIGLFGISLIFLFNSLPNFYLKIYESLHQNFALFSFTQFVLVFSLLLIPTLVMGATWPIVAKFYVKEKVGKGIGEIYSANNVGAIFGSFTSGFLLVPLLGIKESIIFAGILNLIVGSTILLIANKKIAFKVLPLTFLIFILFAIFSHYNIKELSYGKFYYPFVPEDIIKESKLVFYKESPYSTISVLEWRGAKSLMLNGKGQGGTMITDLRINFLLAYIPLLLHENPKTSLLIGLGTGTTASILAKFTNTTTVEIDPYIYEAAKEFRPLSEGIFNNPNHTLVIADARNYLLWDKNKYDIIASEPSDPWQSFSTSLYSKEFYELIKEHLNENGLFVQWVPIYEFTPHDFKMFYKTFNSIFPYVLGFVNLKNFTSKGKIFNPTEIILVGSLKPINLDKVRVSQRIMKVNEIQKDLIFINIFTPNQFFDLYLFNQDNLKGYADNALIITDDRPILEFSSARNILTRERTFNEWVISDLKEWLEKHG